jgi:hypothetical protein
MKRHITKRLGSDGDGVFVAIRAIDESVMGRDGHGTLVEENPMFTNWRLLTTADDLLNYIRDETEDDAVLWKRELQHLGWTGGSL